MSRLSPWDFQTKAAYDKAVAIRNRKIADWFKANPCMTLQQVGDYYGITRERVRQILRAQGATHSRPTRSATWLCIACQKPSTRWRKTGLCKECRSGVQAVCSGCGKLFRRLYSSLSTRRNTHGRVFCNRECYQKHGISARSMIRTSPPRCRRKWWVKATKRGTGFKVYMIHQCARWAVPGEAFCWQHITKGGDNPR